MANPNSQPYDIVFRSVADFHTQTKGTGAKVIPWLQDISLGVRYGVAEVKAQIRATADAGIDGYFLWIRWCVTTRPRSLPVERDRHLALDVCWSSAG